MELGNVDDSCADIIYIVHTMSIVHWEKMSSHNSLSKQHTKTQNCLNHSKSPNPQKKKNLIFKLQEQDKMKQGVGVF